MDSSELTLTNLLEGRLTKEALRKSQCFSFLYVCDNFLPVFWTVLPEPLSELQAPGALVHLVVARLAQRDEVPRS